jgi:hypothetical protein
MEIVLKQTRHPDFIPVFTCPESLIHISHFITLPLLSSVRGYEYIWQKITALL